MLDYVLTSSLTNNLNFVHQFDCCHMDFLKEFISVINQTRKLTDSSQCS